jgi:hypothetical protein
VLKPGIDEGGCTGTEKRGRAVCAHVCVRACVLSMYDSSSLLGKQCDSVLLILVKWLGSICTVLSYPSLSLPSADSTAGHCRVLKATPSHLSSLLGYCLGRLDCQVISESTRET